MVPGSNRLIRATEQIAGLFKDTAKEKGSNFGKEVLKALKMTTTWMLVISNAIPLYVYVFVAGTALWDYGIMEEGEYPIETMGATTFIITPLNMGQRVLCRCNYVRQKLYRTYFKKEKETDYDEQTKI